MVACVLDHMSVYSVNCVGVDAWVCEYLQAWTLYPVQYDFVCVYVHVDELACRCLGTYTPECAHC